MMSVQGGPAVFDTGNVSFLTMLPFPMSNPVVPPCGMTTCGVHILKSGKEVLEKPGELRRPVPADGQLSLEPHRVSYS